MPDSATHQCPAMHCTRRVRQDMLTCRAHWFMIPKQLRDDVWATYAGGSGMGSIEHTEAITAAVDALNEKIRAMVDVMRP
jgi:hypothetical protein